MTHSFSKVILGIAFLLNISGDLVAQPTHPFDHYHSLQEVNQLLKGLEQRNPKLVHLHQLTKSPGGEPLTIVEIGKGNKEIPSIFVGANFEGNIPLATEGALTLAQMIVDSTSYTEHLNWLILPIGNPDAAKGYFAKIRYERTVNDLSINDDMDEAENEDGFDDLNHDGIITQMRVKDLTGNYKVSAQDSRLMVMADPKKGEQGSYKLYTEGIDNDGDGLYNEDGEGGIDVGISFPQLFPKNRKEAGLWPGQTPEVYQLMKYIYDRPQIAMVYVLGSSNTCLTPPKGGRKGDNSGDAIKIPQRFVTMLGADPSKNYTMEEAIEMMKGVLPAHIEVTPSLIYRYFGIGGAVNPMEDDLRFYARFADEYKSFLKQNHFNLNRLEGENEKDGSFELWSYYQLGVPTFSMNLFTIPLKAEELKKTPAMSDDSPKKISDPATERALKVLSYSDLQLDGKGFVPWTKTQHPTLGEVEIGGFVPYLTTTPKPDKVDSLLRCQLPWLLRLSQKLPQIKLIDQQIKGLGDGVYRIELFIGNQGELPYPTAIGERNHQPAPLVLTLSGNIEILEGLKRTPIGRLNSQQIKKFTFLIQAEKPQELKITIESIPFGNQTKTIQLGG